MTPGDKQRQGPAAQLCRGTQFEADTEADWEVH